MGIFGFCQKETIGAKRVAMVMAVHRQHFVSFVIYSFGAKFEDYRSNIARDILDSVFHNFSCSVFYDIAFNLHNPKTLITLKRKKRYSEKKNTILLFLKSLLNKQQLFFITQQLKIKCIIIIIIIYFPCYGSIKLVLALIFFNIIAYLTLT